MNQSRTFPTAFGQFLLSGLIGLAILLFNPAILSAQTWTGATNTDWNLNTNWSSNVVPTGATDVLIPNTANKPIIGSTTDAEAESVKILSGGTLTIEGSLALFPETENGLKSDGTLNNNGTLKIGSATSTIYSGIFSDGTVNNTGTIKIDKVLFDGIITGGIFNNTGSIIIGAVEAIGINGIQNVGLFNNHTGAYIYVDHAGNGILNQGFGTFSNGGTIDIGGINEGIYHIGKYGIQNKASFINLGSGLIHIDRTGKSCVFNEVKTFSNGGVIRLASNMAASKEALVNLVGCTLTNENCATLEANGPLNNNGAINNLGLFIINNYGGILPHLNTGTITNDGVIENTIGDVIPGTLINHDLIVKPISGECIIPNVLERGNQSSFNISATWYFDENLSLPAGNYIQAPNTFLQSNLNLGENRVFFLVEDNDYGCLNMVSQRITLLPDHTAPEVTCKQAVVEVNASGTAVLSPALLMESAEDDCGGEVVPVSVTPNTFSCAQIGQSVYATLTVTDESGNTGTCTASVKVLDLIAPNFICKNISVNLDASGKASITTASVNNGSTDNCGIVVMGLDQTNFTCANVGNNTVLLSGADASGNKGFCTATVTVKDVTAPVAKCKNFSANLAANGSVTVLASSLDNGSTDNCSLSLTLTPYSFNCGNVGINNVTLRATDAGGNTSTCAATVTIKDVTAPNALCKNVTIFLNDLGQATLATSQVNNGSSDACGIATMSVSKTQFNCSDIPGSAQTVTLTLKDVNNNQSTCNAQVTVKDNLAPTAICQNTTVQLGANGTVTVYPANLADNSFDNCSVWSYSPTAKVYTTANIGNNNLNITVKDWSGNGANCVSVVTVQGYNGLDNSSNRDLERLQTAPATANFTLFPNPTAGQATVGFELLENQNITLRVFDLTGRNVLTQNLEGLEGANETRLELGTMPNGIYVVELQMGNVREQKRLMVQAD